MKKQRYIKFTIFINYLVRNIYCLKSEVIFQKLATYKLIKFYSVFQKLTFRKIRESSPFFSHLIKGALSGLRQFLVTESPLKMMKNAFYFTSKALFVLKIFKFLS